MGRSGMLRQFSRKLVGIVGDDRIDVQRGEVVGHLGPNAAKAARLRGAKCPRRDAQARLVSPPHQVRTPFDHRLAWPDPGSELRNGFKIVAIGPSMRVRGLDEEDEVQGLLEHRRRAAHRGLVEGLDRQREHSRSRPIEAASPKRRCKQGQEVDAHGFVDFWILQLHAERCSLAHTFDDLLKRGDAAAGEPGTKPGTRIELLNLVGREVVDEPVSCEPPLQKYVSATRREHVSDIRGPLEGEVVQADQHAVLRHVKVLLDGVGALLERQVV